MDIVHTLPITTWDQSIEEAMQLEALHNLEAGSILLLPQLPFELQANEHAFLTPDVADPKHKNISYQAERNQLWGVQRLSDAERMHLKIMLDRFARHAFSLVRLLLPSYIKHLTVARTSFRPVQISGRKTSFRKDDKRLHVDAFPSAPNQGKRILRVFSNINPHGEDRVWRVGEPFSQVANQFVPQIKKPLPGFSALLRALRITKSYRTLYDHYMLQIHDRMKEDEHYQETVKKQELRFASGSTWIVQTDHVSHAAMEGQYVLEQTFYLPTDAMQDDSHSPLRVLEGLLSKRLV